MKSLNHVVAQHMFTENTKHGSSLHDCIVVYVCIIVCLLSSTLLLSSERGRPLPPHPLPLASRSSPPSPPLYRPPSSFSFAILSACLSRPSRGSSFSFYLPRSSSGLVFKGDMGRWRARCRPSIWRRNAAIISSFSYNRIIRMRQHFLICISR